MNGIVNPGSASAPAMHRGALAAFETPFASANRWAVIALMASMALRVFSKVVSRYVFDRSILRVEEGAGAVADGAP